jgi:membrane protein
MMMICPLLFIMSSSFAIYLTTQIRIITDKIQLLGMVAPVIFFSIDCFPYFIIWVLFTFSYIFLPNTRVRFDSALLAGVIAGTVFQLVQYGYLHFQVGVARYNAIYGSFAALPLFLIWMQISWLIVLFGAEFAFAHQQMVTGGLEAPDTHISIFQKRVIALQLAHLIIKRFERGETPPHLEELAIQLRISPSLAEKTARLLCETRLISAVEIIGTERLGYQPGEDISRLTMYRIIEALDNLGSSPLDLAAAPEYAQLTEALSSLYEKMESAPANRCLKDL